MHEVAEGVIEIPIGFVNAHLVVVNDGAVLVDTGLPSRSAKVEQALHEARRKIGDVHTILLTHWHATMSVAPHTCGACQEPVSWPMWPMPR